MLEPALDPAAQSVDVSGARDAIRFAYPGPSDATFEVSASFDAAARCFETHSAILIRGAADPEPLRALGRSLVAPMSANPSLRATLNIFDCEAAAGLARYALLNAILCSSALALLRRAFKCERLLVFEHNLHRPRILLPEVPDCALPLHQDGGFLGIPMVRGWFLLSPESCGSDAPGIELWTGGPDRILPLETQPASKSYAWLEMSHLERDAIVASCTRWRPSLRIGDALLFRGIVPHRTYVPEAATLPRLSVETTIFPARHDLVEFCLDKDPLRGAFIVGADGFDHVRRIRT